MGINMKQYVASISYGKDSLAMLHVITDVLHWQLDRIFTADVWATDTIPADLPPMVEFKEKADRIIKERWGIEVEHKCAMKNGEKVTYEKTFYHIPKRKNKVDKWQGTIKGFPIQRNPYCPKLKVDLVDKRTERERTAQSTAFRSASNVAIGVHGSKRNPWIPDKMDQLVQRGTQTNGVFKKHHDTRCGYKYCVIHRHCG